MKFGPEESFPVKATVGFIAVLLVVSLIVGGYGQAVKYELEREWDSRRELVALYGNALSNNVNLSIDILEGRLDINFVDDTDLVFWQSMYEWSPHPGGVNQSGNLLDGYCLYFGAAYANVVLGSGYNYTISVYGSGDVAVNMIVDANAHIGNVTITVTRGSIDFQMTDEANIADNITITLEGYIVDVDVTLPPETSGSFGTGYRMFSYTRGITVIPSGKWPTEGPMKTSDYGTTYTSVSIIAGGETGPVSANLA
ncbi:MAG: hypothetical protein JSW05_00005 [Candidatus Thorarchaeota archaeon]|nr:MAG: hypothetical protein JSW05_00005 [Candidatus Thorarchaeota archaeon]